MGQCVLTQVNPKVHYTVTAFPQADFQPATIDLSLDARKNTIHVEKGLSLEGTLLLKDTNTPVPNHQIMVADTFGDGKKTYKYYDISTMTNAEGKFRFTCLPADPISLRPESTMDYYTDDAFSQRTYTPGSKEPVVVYVVPNPHRQQ